MLSLPPKLLSYVSAGFLSALTIATFYLLRNYGPEKAVWRFHDAALTSDQSEIARVTMQPPNTLSVQILETLIRAANKGQPEVISYQENVDEARFSIQYVLPSFQGRTLVANWVVQNTRQTGWVIDASETVESSPGVELFANQVFHRIGMGTTSVKEAFWVK
jgi:hypothetical protein